MVICHGLDLGLAYLHSASIVCGPQSKHDSDSEATAATAATEKK